MNKDEINQAARERFDALWCKKPLGSEDMKFGFFEIYRSGFYGCLNWQIDKSSKPELTLVKDEDDDGS